jgi:GNAT superfamily N-acetyltransferase
MGLVTGHVIPSIHSTPVVALLTTLVVDERCARTGIGKQLATAVEDWAREQGAVRISVTSGKHRDGAHAFYERIGYDRTGVRLTKILRS